MFCRISSSNLKKNSSIINFKFWSLENPHLNIDISMKPIGHVMGWWFCWIEGTNAISWMCSLGSWMNVTLELLHQLFILKFSYFKNLSKVFKYHTKERSILPFILYFSFDSHKAETMEQCTFKVDWPNFLSQVRKRLWIRYSIVLGLNLGICGVQIHHFPGQI